MLDCSTAAAAAWLATLHSCSDGALLHHVPYLLQYCAGTQLNQLQGRYYADLMHHLNINYTTLDQMAI